MRVKNSALNSILGGIYLVIITILGFIFTKVFVTYLGVEFNGLNGLFTNVIAVLSITELGLGGAINFSLYGPVANEEYDKISYIMNLYKKCYRFIGIAIFLFSIAFSFVIQYFVNSTTFDIQYIRYTFILFALSSSLSYFFSYNRNLFYATQQNYIVLTIDFVFRFIKTIVQIICIVKFKSFVLYLLVNLIATFGENLCVHFFARKKFSIVYSRSSNLNQDVKREVRTGVFNSVKKLSALQIMSVGINSTDNIIISTFIDVISVGKYANYNMIIRQLFQLITTFFSGIGASIGNLIAEKDSKKINEVFINLDYLSFFMASFCLVSLLILFQPFIIWYLGKDLLLGHSTVFVLCINLYIQILRQSINYFSSAKGLFNIQLASSGIEVVINLIVSIILASKIGLLGVFIGTLISSLVGWSIASWKFCKSFNLSRVDYLKRQLYYLCISFSEVVCLTIICNFIHLTNIFLNMLVLETIIILVSVFIDIIIVFTSKNTIYLKKLFCEIASKLSAKLIKNKKRGAPHE